MAEDSRLSPERAIRLLRALAGDLEGMVGNVPRVAPDIVAAHLAMVATLLADEIDRSMKRVSAPMNTLRGIRPTGCLYVWTDDSRNEHECGNPLGHHDNHVCVDCGAIAIVPDG